MITINELCGDSKNHELCKKRILLAHCWLKYTNIKTSEIAKKFHRTHGTLSRQIEHFSCFKEKYFLEQKLLADIENELANVVQTQTKNNRSALPALSD